MEPLNPQQQCHGNNDELFDVILNMNDEFTLSLFDEFGNYHK